MKFHINKGQYLTILQKIVKILQKIVDICSEGRKAEGGKGQSNIRAIDLLPFKQ